jgi:uncharacterized protein YcbK (DUF882 family)
MTRKISAHFSRAEFACNCGCGFDTVDVDTLAVVEAVRAHFGNPVVVNSGCRCPEYNSQVGGAPNSQHTLGRAADIRVQGVDSGEVYEWLNDNFPAASLGRYETFTHVDTRTSGPARW